MHRYKNTFIVAVAALMMIPSVLMAQSYGSINTYSPYSMYGLGELATQGTISTRSMGGVGASLRSPSEINLVNPAAYSVAPSKSALFVYGVEGSNHFNTQNQNGSKLKTSYASANFNNIAMQLPLARNMGIGISVTPYSSIGYNISTHQNDSNIGRLSYNYEGNGDLTQVKIGVGWRLLDKLSVGLAAQYYWGSLYRSFSMSPFVVTGNGTYSPLVGESSYYINKIKAQLGLQWAIVNSSKRNLTFGLVYDLGGDLKPQSSHSVLGKASTVSIVATSQEETLSLVLPNQLTAGLSYLTPKLLLGVDYTYQNWASNNGTMVEKTTSGIEVAYNNFGTVKFGAQWTPNRNDVRNYFKRISYRGGLRYGGYQQTFNDVNINQYAVTLGAAFPVKMNSLSCVDLGLEYGARGSSESQIKADSYVGLIGQNYFKVSLGFSLFGGDYWFQRPKFD